MTSPDWPALFPPCPEGHVIWDEEKDEVCPQWFTPHAAENLDAALSFFPASGQEALAGLDPLSSTPLSLDAAREVPALDELPDHLVSGLSPAWLVRFVQTFSDLQDTLRSGALPAPSCVGEEVALYLALDFAATLNEPEDEDDEYDDESEATAAVLDYAHTALFSDEDFLLLFDEDYHADLFDPQSHASQHMGLLNLAPSKWFLPFPLKTEV